MATQDLVPAARAPAHFHGRAALRGPSAFTVPAVAQASAPPAGSQRSTVLVVEDEPLIRLCVCDVLEGAGLGVEQAPDADCALDLLSSLGADENWCRVLVTDVNLGAGLDGIELATEARRSVPGLRVLYVTGNPERVLKGRTGMRPQESVLGKPFQTAELVAAVRSLVASSAAAA